MYRNRKEMYECDSICIDVCNRFLDAGLEVCDNHQVKDEEFSFELLNYWIIDQLKQFQKELLTPAERIFLPCLVFAHSESIEFQRKCMIEFGRVKKLLPPGHAFLLFDVRGKFHSNQSFPKPKFIKHATIFIIYHRTFSSDMWEWLKNLEDFLTEMWYWTENLQNRNCFSFQMQPFDLTFLCALQEMVLCLFWGNVTQNYWFLLLFVQLK